MTNLARARDSLAAFAAMVGHPLTEWQARALDLVTRITAILAPRQSGKSRSLALLALWFAFRTPGARCLIVSAGEEASRRLLAEVRRIAASSPLLRGSLVDEQAGLVTLTNGSEVRSVPASDRPSVAGSGGYASAAQRKPTFPLELSRELPCRAATR